MIFGFSMLISSCIPEPESPKFEVSENSQLMKVREWFEENKTNLRLPERGSNFRTDAQELILPFFEKEPDWDQFHHYYFPDGREVFEINLENAQTFIPFVDASEDVAIQANRSIQNILFVKHPTENRFDPLIVRYYPDEESSKREFKEISYQMIDEKWSGWIDLFTYDEHYFIGFQVEKGQITHTRKFKQEGQNAKKAIGFENKDVRCALVTTDWLNITVAGNVVTITGLNSTTSQSCGMGSYDSGSQSNGSPSYNYGGFPSSGVGSSGAPSGYPVPDDVPLPKLRIYLSQKVSKYPLLECAISKIELSKFIDQLAIFSQSATGANVTLTVGKTQNPRAGAETDGVTYGYNNIIITFNEETIGKKSSLDIARILIHEIILAEIFSALGQERNSSLLVGDFAHNFEIYKQRFPSNNAIQQHEFMADFLVEKIAKELQKLHPYLGKDEFFNATANNWRIIDPGFYTAIALHGFNSTSRWINNENKAHYQKLQELDNRLTKNCQ
jgi:hypothetical protein